MKRVLLLIVAAVAFGWLSSLEFQSAKTSADYDQQMKAAAVRCQQLKDAGIDPYQE